MPPLAGMERAAEPDPSLARIEICFSGRERNSWLFFMAIANESAKAEKPDAEEAKPAAVGKLFSDSKKYE
jgi:hypothetical protein